MKSKSKPTYSVTNCSVTNNHPPFVPTPEHLAVIKELAFAVSANARALSENATALNKAADSLRGPDNNSTGMRFGE
jgi:hypothetical protein